MFYGFPRTGARNIVENERKRYDPWQGGKYGGYLEFKIQDTSYRVTRYFGKTAAKDTFSLLDLSSGDQVKYIRKNLGKSCSDWMRILLPVVPMFRSYLQVT